MPIGRFALLVGPHLLERRLVCEPVALDRNLRGHAAHRKCAATMAGLNAKKGITAHEMRRHFALLAVGEDAVGSLREELDEAEDVVTAPAIQARNKVLELPQNLVHLKGCKQRLDQH